MSGSLSRAAIYPTDIISSRLPNRPSCRRISLVEVFLWEKDIDAAWKTAQEGGCAMELWLKLAKEPAKEHPGDALPICQKQIESTFALKNNAVYEQAVGYLRIIRDLMSRLGQEAESVAHLASFRVAHKPKRSFMKLLERFK